MIEYCVGDKVTFIKGGKKEHGIVKTVKHNSFTKSRIYVVYHCEGNWNFYQNYTSALTDAEHLQLGWI